MQKDSWIKKKAKFRKFWIKMINPFMYNVVKWPNIL